MDREEMMHQAAVAAAQSAAVNALRIQLAGQIHGHLLVLACGAGDEDDHPAGVDPEKLANLALRHADALLRAAGMIR